MSSRRQSQMSMFTQLMQQRVNALQSQQQTDFTDQRAIQQRQLQQEQDAFTQNLAVQKQLAAQNAAAQQAQLDAEIRAKTLKPVKLGTLLTSPSGLLGNPLLSTTKLTG